MTYRIDPVTAGRDDCADAIANGADPASMARPGQLGADEALINAMNREWVLDAAGSDAAGDDDQEWERVGVPWCQAYNEAFRQYAEEAVDLQRVEHEQTAALIDACFFCHNKWGACTCKWSEWDGFEPTQGPGTGFWIWEPNVSECGRFFVDPHKHYGPAFTQWYSEGYEVSMQRLGNAHQAAAGSLCRDDGTGLCALCGVEMATCNVCGGIGYHREGCRQIEGDTDA